MIPFLGAFDVVTSGELGLLLQVGSQVMVAVAIVLAAFILKGKGDA